MRISILLTMLVSVQSFAAFPSIRSEVKGGYDGDMTPSVNMPTTVESDDLLISCMAVDTNSGLTWDTATYGTWTQIATVSVSAEVRVACYGILADGDEDSGSIENTLSSTIDSVYWTAAIQDWENDTVANGVEATTASAAFPSTAPDTPSLTASWGSDDNFWISFIGSDGDQTVSSYAYAGNQEVQVSPGVAFPVTLALSTANVAAATENPPAYTTDPGWGWGGITIVIQPGAATGALLLRRRR